MTKRKQSKKKQVSQQQRRQELAKNTPPKPATNQPYQISKLKIVYGALVFLISISGILFALHPRYSIDVDERFNPYNPFQNPLVITNNGYFPLKLSYSISASNFEDVFHNKYENIGAAGFSIDNLDSDRKAPIDLSKFFSVNMNNFVISSLNLEIDIESQTRIWGKLKYPYTKKENIKYKLKRSHDGKYILQQNG